MKRYLFGLALLAAAAGCNRGPQLVPVKGTLTLDDKPLAFKNVRFIPEPGTPGVGAGANTDGDGTYTLIAVEPGATRDTLGVMPGSYKVVVAEPIFPIEEPLPQASGDGPAPAIGLPDPRSKKQKATIPARYTKPETTPLRVEVPADGGSIELKLTASG